MWVGLTHELIVMTTNRLEQLDAALVRPGRMTKIPLRQIELSSFQQMVKHHLKFQDEIALCRDKNCSICKEKGPLSSIRIAAL
jgi:ATP-dependent 26S proteasome regulatory subunit